jgi:hypothetical protein
LAAFALVAALGGCREEAPTIIDGSSPAAFARTTAAARDDLPAADRLTFDRAIATMPARRYADVDPAARARAAFDGMTAAEVVATETNRMKGIDQ